VKKFVLFVALTLLTTPYLTSAREDRDGSARERHDGSAREDHDRDDQPSRHSHVNATEFAGAGLAVAALIGVAGYVLLRRRGVRQD
jgi:hypothetical protein